MVRPTERNVSQSANLSLEQMKLAIPKIERRIADLNGFDVISVSDSHDPKIDALSHQLDALLVSIFGVNTIEYQRYCSDITELDLFPVNTYSIEKVRDGLRRGIAKSKAILESIRDGFLEELEDTGCTTTSKALKVYEGLELHPDIERAVGKLFRDGHYANAIEDAVKALNALVRLNSNIDNMDGTALMEHVFDPKKPILKFNSLSDTSDIDEQKGFKMMFSGAVAGLRNPRAHKIIKDDPEMALEYIAFVSLLAKLADKARK